MTDRTRDETTLMPALTNDLRVLVVASSPLARAGLSALLEGAAGINVIGQSAGDSDLPDALDVYRPDALAWDMGWEPLQNLERLTEVGGAAVLALIADEATALEGASALIGAGVRGLLLQDVQPDVLVAALNALGHGLVVILPAVAEMLRTEPLIESESTTAPLVDALTPRELEVINLIAEGLPNKNIAAKLKISEHTVKFHVNAILTKLGAQSRTEAVVRATRMGLIAL
ncbi:MAG TPA: response regulator transcription factor [Phototrophicaceae bacterium]|nr:response regulator transcription factor [Phototrophicaceae bacterium]